VEPDAGPQQDRSVHCCSATLSISSRREAKRSRRASGAAAGNAGPKSPPLYPGADPNVIAVTATDADDKLFNGANRGKYISVAAPGVDILVPAPEGEYQITTGTSGRRRRGERASWRCCWNATRN
jgi:hypothetical protein